MKKKLLVTHTIKKEVEIEVDLIDFSLTAEQIDAHLTDVIESVKDKEFEWKTTENIECEWLDEPMLKVQISDEYYRQIGDYIVAANGACLFFKDSPIVFDLGKDFFEPSQTQIKVIESVLNVDFKSLPLHRGYFDEDVASLKQFPNLEVRGKTIDSIGYFISDGKLIAMVMPLAETHPFGQNDYVRFN